MLVAGLASLGFVATLAYVIAGPDGEQRRPAASSPAVSPNAPTAERTPPVTAHP